MKREKINALFKAFGSKTTGYRAGWVEGHCILAPWRHVGGKDAHPSFGIKADPKHKSICKCLSCGFGGDLLDLLFRVRELQNKHPASGMSLADAAAIISNEFEDMELDASDIPDYGDVKIVKDIKAFPAHWLKSFKSYDRFPDAIEYLDGREVSPLVARMLDLRFDPIQRRIGFPFRNFNKEIMGVQGRAIDKDTELRYYQYGYMGHRNMLAWMGEDMIDLDKPLVMLEGPFDFASVFRVYQNVVASFTSGLSVEKLKRLAGAYEIITFYDHGSGGNAARTRIKEVLGKIPMIHLIPTAEEGDAGAMRQPQVAGYLQNLVKLNYID